MAKINQVNINKISIHFHETYSNELIIIDVGCTCSGSCTCLQNPCTCQYGNCPFHTNGFVLPVQYESDGDYVEYDYPERYRRQISRPFAGIPDLVGGMTGQITGIVQNVGQAFNNQPGFFASRSEFSPVQSEGRVSQTTDLVGGLTEHITDAIQNTGRVMSSRQQEPRPQSFAGATDAVGGITRHITGMV